MSYILGIRIDNLNFKQVMAKVAIFFSTPGLKQIATVNPEFILAAKKDKKFKDILNSTALNVPDGAGLKVGGAILGQKIGERITGVDLTWEIVKWAAENSKSVFLLGGKKNVASVAAQRMRIVHPDIKIAGVSDVDPDDPNIVNTINKSKADILLVAYGAPKQELFIDKIVKLRIVNCKLKIAIGVGGTFDYIAGVLPRAPKWMRSLGLEWLYRLFHQPKRIGRIFNAVIIFPIICLWTRIFK